MKKAKSNKIPVPLGKNKLLRIFMYTWIPVMLQCRFRLLFHVVQRWDFTERPFHDICSYDTLSKKARFISIFVQNSNEAKLESCKNWLK